MLGLVSPLGRRCIYWVCAIRLCGARLVATVNFVPYLGALTGIICMTLGAVLSFDSLGYAMVFPTSYLVLAILEGNFITPLVLGRSLTLNPVVILIGLAF